MTVQKIRLDYTPRPWQKECHLRRKRFTVLAVHRRAGKTFLAIMELIDKAMRFQGELGAFYYVAPELKQAKRNVWARLKMQLRPLLIANAIDFHEQETSVTFRHNGAKILLCGGDDPNSIRGAHMDGVVIDEVAQTKVELWEQVIRPMLADRLGWALFIGTPHGINLFSELFFYAQGSGEDSNWMAKRMNCYETNALAESEVADMKERMSPQVFAREMLCDFAASGDDQLISLIDVEDAARRTYTERDIAHAPRIVGVDPARFGDDRSVIVKRQGLQMFPALVFRGIDNMDLAARVADVWKDWQPDAVFVDSGAGAGVLDRLRQLHFSPVEVPFGGKAVQAHQFVNRRTEMWWGVREWLTSGGAIPDDRSLKQELATPIYWFDPAGRKVLEPKDDIKKRLHEAGSPDIADALCLTFAAPVQPRPQGVASLAKKGERFDPFKPWKR